MKSCCLWLLLFGILAACTCGGRTNECNNDNIKLTLLTNIHDDPSCKIISKRGVTIYEAAKLIADKYNVNSDNTMKIDLSVMDTCGSVAGTIKAAISALVSSGLDCIHPPHYLGIIGPEMPMNVDAIQKLTSVLNIPHIVESRLLTSPYLHHLAKESEYYIVQGVLEVIDALRWNTFTLITRKDYNNNHDNDIELIGRKVTMTAIARGLCVLIHDQDDITNSLSSHIVHIGIPERSLFEKVNGTILIVSEGSSTSYISELDSNNSIIFLEDSRNDFNDLEMRVINSNWWTNESDEEKYNAEYLRDVRWLKDAIDIYTTSLNILCDGNKCTSEINPAKWNSVIANVIAKYNAKAPITPKIMKLLLKDSYGNSLETIGELSIINNHVKLHWIHDDIDESLQNKEILPESFVEILSNTNDKSKINCAALVDTSNKNHNDDVARIFFATFDDHEWWTMMLLVGGIGTAMFTFGFLAVYIVYTNVRGPKRFKNNRNGRRVSRDLSLRQVNTPIHVNNDSPPPPPLPPQRLTRHISRHDSIRSDMSDKSV